MAQAPEDRRGRRARRGPAARRGEHASRSGVVESVQRSALTEPLVSFDEAGAHRLGLWYWASVRHATRGVVRTRVHSRGVDLTFAGIVALLRFGPAEPMVSEGHVSCAYPITGGLLALSAGGRLEVEQQGGPDPTLSIAVRGYHARLAMRAPWLYRRVQAPAHLAVSRRFLQRPSRRLAR